MKLRGFIRRKFFLFSFLMLPVILAMFLQIGSASANIVRSIIANIDLEGNSLWAEKYDGKITAFDIDDEGNVCVATGRRIFLYNSFGESLPWELSESPIYVNAIDVDLSGNVYMVGYSYFGTNTDLGIMKYNALGSLQWQIVYDGPAAGDDNAVAMGFDAVGNLYVAGTSYGGDTGIDLVLFKYDSAGQEQWSIRVNGPGNGDDVIFDMAVDGNGNVYVTGSVDSGDLGFQFTTAKYDANGIEQWVHMVPGWGTGKAIILDQDNNPCATGFAESYVPSFNFRAHTIKYNKNGDVIWNVLESNLRDSHSVSVDLVGNSYISGPIYESDYFADAIAAVKYGSNGEELWRFALEADSDQSGMALDQNNNVFVAINRKVDDSYLLACRHAMLAIYNLDENELWLDTLTSLQAGAYCAEDVAVGPFGNAFVVGAYEKQPEDDTMSDDEHDDDSWGWGDLADTDYGDDDDDHSGCGCHKPF